ncbi:multicomponent Na+:H+ antiporter subunit B [Orenia metallireducens]|uniref:Multicomponent Na+:H+ antiporter subunit B n=1 Tax=Orenia metallireducens TaxID=1413210 RepID=A0A285GSZ3_9FIRM|nr:hydrogen gas-evolving membrane-bound hydrogenase subunit E [Orenia metallireducens]PRX32633.1 multicomponent Na+:H+ antiporter subunit B [Orenia metallireducens]SNY26605.1 multicomponent Na+:H+ antiporter subunit B [Orenia metallireducens]
MSRVHKIFRKFYKIGLVLFLAIFLLFIFDEIQNLDIKRYLSEHYISEGVQETGAINLVTSVLYDYRGFDTLGEATVILTAAATLSFMTPIKKVKMLGTEFTIIIYQTIIIIIPFLVVLGMNLIFFGHISPGGGFVGGVILAMIPILVTINYGITFSENKLKPNHKSLLEGIGAIGFILLGLLGIFAGSNFLASGQANFGLGNPGELISAGLIPYLNLMIGIKVGAGLAAIFNSLIKEG